MDAIGRKHPLAAVSLDLGPPVKPAVSQGQSVLSEERTGLPGIGTRMLVLPRPSLIVMTVLSYCRSEVFN